MNGTPHQRTRIRRLLVAVTTAGVTGLSLAVGGPVAAAASAGHPATRAPGPRVSPGTPEIVPYATAPDASPAALLYGPQGKLWFTEDVSAAEIGSFDPSTGAFAYHALNMGIFAFKAQGLTADRAGHLWMSANTTYAYQYNPFNGSSEHYLRSVTGSEQSVALGPDGDLWFTGFTAGTGALLYRVDPKTAVFTPFPIAGGADPFGITSGPGGDLWFTDVGTDAIGQLDPGTGHSTEYPIPTAGSQPETITVGPDGDLWFTEHAADRIGRLDPTTHVITEYPVPTAGAAPRCITVGPDGDLWFTEEGHAAIGQVDPATGAITEYSVAGADPFGASAFLDGITVGPDKNLWVTDEQGELLRVSLSPTVVTEPSSQSAAVGATVRFTSTARGVPAPSVQWQSSSDDGGGWSPIAGATSTSLSVRASPASAGRRYRAVFTNPLGTTVSSPATLRLTTPQSGYWLAGRDGGVFAFGTAPFLGSLPADGIRPPVPVVAMAATRDGRGYWLAGADGGVFAFGDARFFGSLPGLGITPTPAVVGMAATTDGRGYWLVGADGAVFAFGDAGSSGPGATDRPATVGIADDDAPGVHGYWSADRAGSITPGGTAGSFGSLTTAFPPVVPAAPVVALAGTTDGRGYWLAGTDGGVFAFGQAGFFGSLPGSSPPVATSAPITALAPSPDGRGYWLAGADGGLFAFGDARFAGSLPALGVTLAPTGAITAIAAPT